MATEETKLIIADKDRPLAFLELDDVTLGRFARSYLIQMERSIHKHAGDKEMPLALAMSMHGAIALYRMAAEANAGEMHLKHAGVEWGGEQHGDWEVIVRRQSEDDDRPTCIGCTERLEWDDLRWVTDDNGETGCPACFTEDGSGECWRAQAIEARSGETVGREDD